VCVCVHSETWRCGVQTQKRGSQNEWILVLMRVVALYACILQLSGMNALY